MREFQRDWEVYKRELPPKLKAFNQRVVAAITIERAKADNLQKQGKLLGYHKRTAYPDYYFFESGELPSVEKGFDLPLLEDDDGVTLVGGIRYKAPTSEDLEKDLEAGTNKFGGFYTTYFFLTYGRSSSYWQGPDKVL